MRDIDSNILAELAKQELRPFMLLDMEIDSTHYRYTDCDVPIVFDEILILDDCGDTSDIEEWSESGDGLNPVDNQVYVKQGSHSMALGFDLDLSGNVYGQWSNTLIGGDFSAYEHDWIYIWVYIPDTDYLLLHSAASYFLIGSPGGFIVFHIFKPGMVNGWNLFKLDLDNPDSVDGIFDWTDVSFVNMRIREAAECPGDFTIYFDSIMLVRPGGGNTYSPLGFSFGTVSYSAQNIVDSVKVEIDNLDSVMTSLFVGGTPQGSAVKLDLVVLDASYNIIANDSATLFEGEIDAWDLDEETLSITVTSLFSQWSQRTLSKHSASCRWKKFKGTECGYSGGETWCDRTYARCVTLANTANFGGFRWLPSIIDKEIWWGRVQGSA